MSDDEEISVYDEVEIEDMTYDETLQTYHYPCPCGDRFEIALADLQDESNDIAVCPSCSLMIRVIYEVVSEPASQPASLTYCDVVSHLSPDWATTGRNTTRTVVCVRGDQPLLCQRDYAVILTIVLRNRITYPSPTSRNPTPSQPPTRSRRKSPLPLECMRY